MAKIEYKAECLCGGKILTIFKKPTRMEHTVTRAACRSCGSEFMFIFSVDYNDGSRAYVPSHEVINITPKLHAAIKEKKEQLKEDKSKP